MKIFIAVIGMLLLLGYCASPAQKVKNNGTDASKVASKNTQPQQPQMSAAQHLLEAKNALADGYKPNKDTTKASWGRVNDAKEHLAAISITSPEWTAEAKKLHEEVRRREKEIDKVANIVAKKLVMQQRKDFAAKYESSLLDKGMDVHASVAGKASETLKIKWVLVSRPLVHNLINDQDFISKLRSFGFKKLILSDGYDSSWSVDL